jgi:hypothetical protein
VKPTPVWPASLPTYVLAGSFKAKDQDGAIRFQPERGEPLARPGSTAVVTVMSGAFLVTSEELDVLNAFYREDTAMGSVEFDLPDPRTGEFARFVFTEAPQIEDASGPDLYRVTLSLMRLP